MQKSLHKRLIQPFVQGEAYYSGYCGSTEYRFRLCLCHEIAIIAQYFLHFLTCIV